MKIYNQNANIIALSQYQDPLLNHITKHLLRKLPTGRGKMLLDIGCGIGRVAFVAVNLGYKVVGVDIEPKAIRLAISERKRKGMQKQCRFYLGDILTMKGIAKASFDVIICSEVIEHVKEPQRIVDRAYEMLKENGMFILSTPHDSAQWTVLDEYAQHVQRFRISDIRRLFQRFRIDSLITLGFPSMRSVMKIYDKIVRWGNLTHSGTWRTQQTRRSFYQAIMPILLNLDDFFVHWNLGTTILIVAKKV